MYQCSQALQVRLGHLRPAPVELGKHKLNDALGLHLVASEEVGHGLQERTFSLGRGGVLLIADRRHASPSF
jgi:hypothetical protein